MRASSSRSSRTSGRVTSANTADLRLPGGSATTTNRFSGSCQPGRTWIRARPPAAVARAASTSMPGRSGGVWVAVASARTQAARKSGRASTGERGKVNGGPQRGRLLPLVLDVAVVGRVDEHAAHRRPRFQVGDLQLEGAQQHDDLADQAPHHPLVGDGVDPAAGLVDQVVDLGQLGATQAASSSPTGVGSVLWDRIATVPGGTTWGGPSVAEGRRLPALLSGGPRTVARQELFKGLAGHSDGPADAHRADLPALDQLVGLVQADERRLAATSLTFRIWGQLVVAR